MDKLLELLNDIRPDLDFEKEERLLDDNILDSFDVITVVSELNDAFGIKINIASLTPENLNSVKAMQKLIEQLQK